MTAELGKNSNLCRAAGVEALPVVSRADAHADVPSLQDC